MFMLTPSKSRNWNTSPSRFSSNFLSDFDWGFYPLFDSLLNQRRVFPSDLQEKDGKYILTIDMPSIKKENLQIKFSDVDKCLTISICNEISDESDSSGYIWKERRIESYSRSFRFPSEVDVDTIEAELVDGTLLIGVNKVEKLIPTDREIIVK